MRPPPFAHQVVDTQALVDKPFYALFNEPGTGKSRTVVDAIFAFVRQQRLDRVIIVCPAAVRSIWADPSPVLGEFTKWAPPDLPYTLREYTAKFRFPDVRDESAGVSVLVTNPEFLRRKERLDPLVAWAKVRRTFLVLDESWAYKTPNAAQTKAVRRLRRACGRVVILNGSPGAPHEQYSQFSILHRGILDVFNYAAFKARYCVMGGFKNYQIVGYQNMAEFHARTAPYCIVRKLRECVDIGPEPLRTQIEATLTPKTWTLYADLRDELIAWLTEHAHVTALQAGVKVLRLAQIVNGFVGGVEEPAALLEAETTENVSKGRHASGGEGSSCEEPGAPPSPLREVGREKLDALIDWLRHHWRDPKLLIFTRFRADVERTAIELRHAFPGYEVARLYGAQTAEEREQAKLLLAPGGDPHPALVVANAQSGGAGINLAATQLCCFLANDFSYRIRRQAEGRVDRPGQTGRATFLDVLAVGPRGERTVDHHILAALRNKEAIETWTTSEWLRILKGTQHGEQMGVAPRKISAAATQREIRRQG
jgi:SNF2 family DNA or RNA helicase